MTFITKKPHHLLLFIGLFLISLNSSATSCTISGAVNSSTSPCNSTVDTIYLTGTLTMNTNLNYAFDVVFVINGGTLYWTNNVDLILTTNSQLLVINGGTLTGFPCNSQKNVTFGTVDVISCNGGGQGTTHSFASINSAGGFNIAVLPVALIEFTGVALPSNKIKLSWTTVQEINNKHFEIECLMGNDTFEKIGELKGNINSTSTINYQFTHNTNLSSSPMYRLKQVDFDGNIQYSKVITVLVINDLKKATLSPNPIQQGPNIKINIGNKDFLKFRLIAINGTILMEGPIDKGIINLEHLVKGVVYVELTDKSKIKTFRKLIITE